MYVIYSEKYVRTKLEYIQLDDRYFECCLIRTFAISNKISGPLRVRKSGRLLYISNKPLMNRQTTEA